MDDCGKRKKQKVDKTNGVLRGLSVHEMVELVKEYMPYVNRPQKLRRAELCATLGPFADQIATIIAKRAKRNVTHLKYDDANSCFIDTLLTSFFLSSKVSRRGWVESTLLRMEESPLVPEIRRLYTLMHMPPRIPGGTLTASLLRRAMQRHFPHGEWLHTQNDPNEVLELIGLPHDITVQLTLRNGSCRREKWAINTLSVDIDMIKDIDIFDLRTMFRQGKQDKDTGIITRVIHAPALYVPVFRGMAIGSWRSGRKKKLTTPVIAPSRPNLPYLKDGRPLKLRAIVVHMGSNTDSGHYVAALRIKGKGPWVLYDDMNPTRQRQIGYKLSEVWEWDNGFVAQNAVGFFYST